MGTDGTLCNAALPCRRAQDTVVSSLKGNLNVIIIILAAFTLHVLKFLQVFRIAYCDYYDPSLFSDWSGVCREFVEAVSRYQPDMLKKQKVHLMLHLVECM